MLIGWPALTFIIMSNLLTVLLLLRICYFLRISWTLAGLRYQLPLEMTLQYLCGANELSVVQDSTEYISNTIFAHKTLPKCKHIRTKSYDFQKLQTIRLGHKLSIKHYFNNPLPKGVKFVKPILNACSKASQGVNTNFTWMPMKCVYFRTAFTPSATSDYAAGWNIRCFGVKNLLSMVPTRHIWYGFHRSRKHMVLSSKCEWQQWWQWNQDSDYSHYHPIRNVLTNGRTRQWTPIILLGVKMLLLNIQLQAHYIKTTLLVKP